MRLRAAIAVPVLALAALTAPALSSIAAAQVQPPQTGMGEVVGQVARCAGNLEIPVTDATLGIQDGQPNLAQTDSTGSFSMQLQPGLYAIVATAADGSSSAVRVDVPVSADQVLDIGILDLGAGFAGCGDDSGGGEASVVSTPTAAPLLPTVTPSNTGG